MSDEKRNDIAIIGLSCRFPGADNPDEFWQLLCNGVDAITEVPVDRWDADKYYSQKASPGKISTRWGGFIKDIDQFDAPFFAISPREAEKMDPQQRLVLEVSWEALERAGIAPNSLSGSKTGVFIGISHSNYEKLYFSDSKNFDAYCATGASLSIAANRLSYFLNLKGPSLAIDTACSSSLVAVHQACQSLRYGETDLSLVGGVNVILAPEMSMSFSQAGMMSADGRCKTFCTDADGYSRAEGCGIVILKRMEDALADGDNIMAVIRGSAVNQDGASNGLTAPYGPSQVSVIREALANANIKPSLISYIEAHGTGTSLGDPIEMNSIKEALIPGRDLSDRCYVGTVKTNIGHLESAAGIAGLIKVILAMQHNQIPAHLHLKNINPLINIEGSPIDIPSETMPWPSIDGLRIAGLSSFGFGGTNCHCVIEAVPKKDSEPTREGWHIFTLSAKSTDALELMVDRYYQFLTDNKDVSLADCCFTVNTGRKHFRKRRAFVVNSKDQLCKQLRDNHADQYDADADIKELLKIKDAYLDGQDIDWKKLYAGSRRNRIALPTYAFQHRRYWLATAECKTPFHKERSEKDSLTKSNILDKLNSESINRHTELLISYLSKRIATVMNIENSEIDVNQPLIEYGLDSIMALVLANYIKVDLGIDIEQAEFISGDNIVKIVDRLKGSVSQSQPACVIKKICRTGELPLSFAQQRLWFLDQLEGRSATYNVSGAIRIQGKLDLSVLERSVNEIVARHEILRTNFVKKDGQPHLIISDQRPLSIDLLDLRVIAEENKVADLNRRTAEEVQQSFDITCEPLLRIKSYRLQDEEHILLLTIHHIISDGWSLGVLIREISALYDAYSKGQSNPLPDLDIQYVDFAHWQKAHLTDKNLASHIEYWNKQLYQVPRNIDLLADRERPSVMTFKGKTKTYAMSTDLSNKIERLAKANHSTNYMTLLTSFASLVSYLTNKQDVVIATPVANRVHAQIEPLIGFFVNTLPIRIKLQPEVSFNNLLDNVRNVCQQAYSHQELPFERLLEELSLSRDLSRAPLSQVAFALQEDLVDQITLKDLKINNYPLEFSSAKTDLLLTIEHNKRGLKGIVEYNTDLFDETTIDRFMGMYMKLLETIVDKPKSTVSELYSLAQFDAINDRKKKGGLAYYLEQTNLTENQLHIWFGQKLIPNNPLYNCVAVCTINERVFYEHFQKAFQQAVDAHDNFRTIFIEKDGVPYLEIREHLKYTVQLVDFSASNNALYEAREWIKGNFLQIFRLEECNFKCALLKVSEERYLWFINQHHIVTDGWSQELIYQYMVNAYKQSMAGALKASTVDGSFKPFIEYEHAYRKSSRFLKDQTYWRTQLTQEYQPLNFYGHKPDKTSTDVENFPYEVNVQLLQQIDAMLDIQEMKDRPVTAKRHYFFLALFALFLTRICGKDTIVIGVPIHNRNSRKLKKIAGLIMQIVPLRIGIDEEQSLVTLIQQVEQVMMMAMKHGQYVVKNSPRTPVYDVLFNYYLGDGPNFCNAPTSKEWLQTPQAYESISLKIYDFEKQSVGIENLILDFSLNQHVFDEKRGQKVSEQYVKSVKSALRDIRQPLTNINMIPSEEKQRLLNDINNTKTKFSRNKCVHQLFEEQVEVTPQKKAIVFGEESLTYAELNSQANRLACHLVKRGVASNQLVGVCMEPGPDMVVAMMGILKCGAAYVPLDPVLPKERLDNMIKQSKIGAVVSARFQSLKIEIVTIEKGIKDEENNLSIHSAEGRNLVYSIFTSGTTGIPKAAGNYHHSFVNLVQWYVKELQLTREDDTLLISNFSFDLTQKNIFAPLICGGTLHICTQRVFDPKEYLKEIHVCQATWINCTPSMFYSLIDVAKLEGYKRLASLRHVVLGGEEIDIERLIEWFENPLNKARIINSYGPTECCDVSSFYTVTKPQNYMDKEVPIGRPISNVNLYILDKYLKPVPESVIGELCIAGIGVGAGYVGDQLMLESMFLHNPFGEGRLYRTGDMAKFLPCGNIEFIGRQDNQVKVRGYRIELGEIESHLSSLPEVKTSAVIIHPQRKQLIAYCVPSNGPIEYHDVKRVLQQRLPEYMIPSQFMSIDNMPLNANGKLDRQALPKQISNSCLNTTKYVAPRTPLEKKLADIWAEVLGLDKVGIHDNFFDLGGHSLLLVQLLDKCQSLIENEISMINLFQDPTIAGVVCCLESEGSSSTQPDYIDLSKEAILDDEIDGDGLQLDFTDNPQSIFLTGATGFVGAFLLKEILNKTTGNLYCLVRSNPSKSGKERIIANLKRYGVYDEKDISRIIAVNGDLAKPYLGLTEDEFGDFAQKMDVIYHNGALVSFAAPYSVTKPTIVSGTRWILKLATLSKIKPVHYVSTLGIFSSDRKKYHEYSAIEDQRHTSIFGYEAAKWVAEKLITLAQKRGVPCTIYRCGVVSGNSDTGICNQEDFSHRLIMGCAELGYFPKEVRSFKFDVTPVNYISRSLVALSQERTSIGKVYHLNNPMPSTFSHIFKVFQKVEKPIKYIPYQQWLKKVKDYDRAIEASVFRFIIPVLSLYEMYFSINSKDGSVDQALQARFNYQFDCHRSVSKLAGLSITCPVVDPPILEKYRAFLSDQEAVKECV